MTSKHQWTILHRHHDGTIYELAANNEHKPIADRWHAVRDGKCLINDIVEPGDRIELAYRYYIDGEPRYCTHATLAY